MTVQNIAVVRALGGLGDVLCAVPALRRLRAAYPLARISYIGLSQVEHVVSHYPELVDRFLTFPGFPGVLEHPFDPSRLTAFLDEQRGTARFDLALQMHGSGGVTNVFTALLGAREMAGFYIPQLWHPEGKFAAFPDALPEVERWQALMDVIDAPAGKAQTAFPVTDAHRDRLYAIAPALTRRPYVVVHAGASDARRRWPARHFARVGDFVASLGLQVVLTGTPSEAAVVEQVEAAMTKKALNLCGATDLGAAAALIERAQLVVTNDTGTSHLAAALATPSIVVFIASDPARWAPLDRRLHRVVGAGVPDVPFGSKAAQIVPSVPDFDLVASAIDEVMAIAA